MQPDYHPEMEEEIQISDYWRILKRHKWTVMTILFVTVLIVTVASIMMTPVYPSPALSFLSPPPASL